MWFLVPNGYHEIWGSWIASKSRICEEFTNLHPESESRICKDYELWNHEIWGPPVIVHFNLQILKIISLDCFSFGDMSHDPGFMIWISVQKMWPLFMVELKLLKSIMKSCCTCSLIFSRENQIQHTFFTKHIQFETFSHF